MKKILLLVVCCLCFCGCNSKNQTKTLYCIEESNNKDLKLKYERKEYYIYFDNEGLTSKICNQGTEIYEDLESAIEAYKFVDILYGESATLNDSTITIKNNCNENPVEKDTIEKVKEDYEYDSHFTCEIIDTN